MVFLKGRKAEFEAKAWLTRLFSRDRKGDRNVTLPLNIHTLVFP